jgi:fatty acid desaturase
MTAAVQPNPKSLARQLRPLLPLQAFQISPARLALVPINLAILGLGWQIASRLDRLPPILLLAWLPLAVVMGNSVFVLGLLGHDLMHGNLPRHRTHRRLTALLSFAMSWMTPTLWQAVHNREHHSHTNGLRDPDRSYLASQPSSWGKRLFGWIAPSSEVNPLVLTLGMTSAWPLHHFRTNCAVLLFNRVDTPFTPASFRVSTPERRAMAFELAVVVVMHALVVCWIGLKPMNLLLGYFLPLWIGYAMAMAYIYTHHMLSPLTENNDPLLSSLSLQVPGWLDLLHCNFSHHSEHHLFPGLNSNYYPQVRTLLMRLHGDRFNLMRLDQAWRLMLATPRFYHDSNHLVTADGAVLMSVPLPLDSGPTPSNDGEQPAFGS